MKIKQVELELRETPAMPKFDWRAGLPVSESAHISGSLRIHTDEGIIC
jgi:hypothetical protein